MWNREIIYKKMSEQSDKEETMEGERIELKGYFLRESNRFQKRQ
jgi:hypothetical protein